jgi:hypothetical protein
MRLYFALDRQASAARTGQTGASGSSDYHWFETGAGDEAIVQTKAQVMLTNVSCVTFYRGVSE